MATPGFSLNDGVIFPLSRFQARKSHLRGDWYVIDRNRLAPGGYTEYTGHRVSFDRIKGEKRYMSMVDALETADWLNEACRDGRIS